MTGLLVYHALAFVSPRARVLPATVASPVCVASTPADLERLEVAADFTGSGSATQSFASLGLPPTVVSNLEELLGAGALPNALQAASYSVLAGGRDAVIDAHTGSGKTLALLLPVVSQLDAAVREPQALILCPSRELAHQVARESQEGRGRRVEQPGQRVVVVVLAEAQEEASLASVLHGTPLLQQTVPALRETGTEPAPTCQGRAGAGVRVAATRPDQRRQFFDVVPGSGLNLISMGQMRLRIFVSMPTWSFIQFWVSWMSLPSASFFQIFSS